MLEILRKAYLMSLGVAGLSRDKIEEVVEELIKRGEIAEKDRKSVMKDLMERAKDEQKKFQGAVKESVQKVISEIGVPTRKEFKELTKRVEDLEKASHSHRSESANDSSAKNH